MGHNYNDSVRRNNPVWNSSTHGFQVTIGLTASIDLSDPGTVATGGVGAIANKLRSGYVMISHQSGAPVTIQNGRSVADYANHGISLMPGATFEFAVGAMTNPLAATSNAIIVKGTAGDVFSVMYFD